MEGLSGIDHVGIAVADLEPAIATYARLLGVEPSHREVVERDGIEAVMFQLGDTRVELLGSVRETSTIAGFLAKRGGGLHHVAFKTGDVQAALDHYAGLGMRLIDACPRAGAAGRIVAFVHPSAADGVLTELVLSPPS